MATTSERIEPRVSIAMATYNGAEYIREQLESLAAQVHLPRELVVCDDGSTDATLSIVEAFAATAPFAVRIYRNPSRLGYGDNFLQAAELCRFDWTAFCDQDDIWLTDKLRVVSKVIERHPDISLVAHSARLVDRNLNDTGQIVRPTVERAVRPFSVSPWISWMGCGQVFRSDLARRVQHGQRFLEALAPPRVAAHDTWIMQLAQCFGAIYFLPRPLLLWRRHAGAATVAAQPRLEPGHHRALSLDVSEELARASQLARSRSDVFAFSAGLAAPPESARLKEAARHYDIAARILGDRAAWRRKGGIARRRDALRLLGDPSYWTLGGGIAGWRGAARDVLDCTCSRRTLRQQG